MWSETGGWGMGWMGFGVVHSLLFWSFVVLAVLLLVRLLWGGGRETRRRDNDPIDILKERYARGEIDHAEFEERKKRLRE